MECEKTYYRITKEVYPFEPSSHADIYKNWLKRYYNMTIAKNVLINIGNNITLLDVFFHNLNFLEITQFPKMIASDLVSIIGGTIGLFLGISLLSFVEIIEFTFETIKILTQSREVIAPMDE